MEKVGNLVVIKITKDAIVTKENNILLPCVNENKDIVIIDKGAIVNLVNTILRLIEDK